MSFLGTSRFKLLTTYQQNASIYYHPPTDYIQYLYDLCLVRPFENAEFQLVQPFGIASYYSIQLGNCPVWVLFPGACQQIWLFAQRRTIQSMAVESIARSHHTDCFHHLYPTRLQEWDLQVESCHRVHFSHFSSLFYF